MALNTNIIIRRAEREDLDTVVEWMEDPDFQFFLYGDPARSPKQIREQIVALLGRSVGHTLPGGLHLIIESKDEGPIGLLSLQNISWRNRSCSLDLYLGKKEARRGLVVTIAFYRAMEYCFDELNLHRVSAFVYSFNTASWRILEKRGNAKLEMVLREHVMRDGKLHDMHCYGLLRGDFEKTREYFKGRLSGLSLQDMISALEQDEVAEMAQ